MKRIFIAISLSTELQETVRQWQQRHLDSPVRWIAGKNVHITLVPPWEEENINKIVDKLSQISFPKFQLNFHTISFGPSPRKPRLIWMVGEDNQDIDNLRIAIHKRLKIPIDQRPFKVHATIARFKPEDFKKFPIKKLNEPIHLQETISSFVLMESILAPSGAEYKMSNKFKLL